MPCAAQGMIRCRCTIAIRHAAQETANARMVRLEPDDGPRARCVVRRAKKIDRKHDIPYLAGYSQDGKTIYIDRHMPKTMKYDGREIDTDRYLILHEEVEKTLIDQLNLHYLHAHQIASRAEQAAVRAAGIRWPTTTVHAEIRQAHRRRAAEEGAGRSRPQALSRRARLRSGAAHAGRIKTKSPRPSSMRDGQARDRAAHAASCAGKRQQADQQARK